MQYAILIDQINCECNRVISLDTVLLIPQTVDL